MAEVAATGVPGKIPTLLEKIKEVGVPPKATGDWLKTIGFKSSNDRTLIPVLRQIDFIGTDGTPTQRWRDYRGANAKQVLGNAIQEGYPKLYETYADAHVRASADIFHVFSAQSSAGKQTTDRMVSTFKALVALADFAASPVTTAESTSESPPADVQVLQPLAASTRTASSVVISVNIQLTVPDTADSKVFDAFFKSMKTHLLSEDDS